MCLSLCLYSLYLLTAIARSINLYVLEVSSICHYSPLQLSKAIHKQQEEREEMDRYESCCVNRDKYTTCLNIFED